MSRIWEFSTGNGTKFWYQDAMKHRIDGPAVEWENGDKEWWLYGTRYDPIVWLLKVHEWGLK